MNARPRAAFLLGAVALTALVLPASFVVPALLAVAGATVVDAFYARRTPSVERTAPPVLSRGIPATFSLALAGATAFFGKKHMIGVVLADDLHDLELSLRVDLRDEVVVSLRTYIEAVQTIQTADDDFAGTARRAYGDIEQGLHGQPQVDNVAGKERGPGAAGRR